MKAQEPEYKDSGIRRMIRMLVDSSTIAHSSRRRIRLRMLPQLIKKIHGHRLQGLVFMFVL